MEVSPVTSHIKNKNEMTGLRCVIAKANHFNKKQKQNKKTNSSSAEAPWVYKIRAV